eukprot:g952.t1
MSTAQRMARDAERLQNESLAREKKLRGEREELKQLKEKVEAKLSEKRAAQEANDGALDDLNAAKASLKEEKARGEDLQQRLTGGQRARRSRPRAPLEIPAPGAVPADVQGLSRLVAKARVELSRTKDERQNMLRVIAKLVGSGAVKDHLQDGGGLDSLVRSYKR